MDQTLFSETIPDYSGKIENPHLLSTLSQLEQLFPEQDLVLKAWDADNIAIPVSVDVSVPQFGNADGIDIRAKEPIILIFHIKDYPFRGPLVYPDRLDFPKDKLGHLYIATNGKPPQFCLIRGGINEWYSNKQIKDLIIRVKNWFRDAVTGELNKDGDEFEPLRLEGYNGSLTYDYNTFYNIVNGKRSYVPEANFAKLLLKRNSGENEPLSWKYLEEIKAENLAEKFIEIKADSDKADDQPEKKFLYTGYILWSESDKITDHYCVNLPANWEEFRGFCKIHSISLDGFEKELALTSVLRHYMSVPIIVGIRRPKKIIGLSGDIEFVNFHVRIPRESIVEEKISPDLEVKFKQHKQPLTIEKAAEISGHHDLIEVTSLVAGCGALGSRIVLHLSKSGYTNMWLADKDYLLPHNFVRHPLSAKYIGINKAVALHQEIEAMYSQTKIDTIGVPLKAEGIIKLMGEKKDWKKLLDFTASSAFSQYLITEDLLKDVDVIKAYITDFGNLGLLCIEGTEHNPRIDDIQVLLYNEALNNPQLSDWLKREQVKAEKNTNITVGLGCNSETTILSEEEVACHAAVMSGILREKLLVVTNEVGTVFTNQIIKSPYFHSQTTFFAFGKLTVLNAANDNTWQIRFANGITGELTKQMQTASPRETGGVFIGSCNYKTRTIHVVGLIAAPPDSKANEVCFFRGIEGLADKVDDINEKTGNQLGYVGEWHTHPKGPEGLSATDFSTVSKFKDQYSTQPTPLPVFLTIVTPKSILPFVF